MKTTQPNLEKVKALFYDFATGSNIPEISVLLSSIQGDYRNFYVRKKEFIDDLNKFLDQLDIRNAGALIDIMVDNKVKIPNWMKNKKYCIEYNNYNFLDLIIL